MKKSTAATAIVLLAALCAGFYACDGSRIGTKPAPAKKTVTAPAPKPTPASKWVGRWVNQKGNTSYIIDAEKSGTLTGYVINSGGGKDRITMRLTGPNTATWTTPIGVQVKFTYQGSNQVLVTAVGVNATVLKIVK
jgi:hypothetical protein